jgi:polygalacturonase
MAYETAGVDGIVNVRDFGAQGNGQNNDSTAFTDAILYLRKRGGGDVIVPVAHWPVVLFQ